MRNSIQLTIVMLLMLSSLYAQQSRPAREAIPADTDSFALRQSFLVPFSERLFADGAELHPETYDIDYVNGIFRWLQPPAVTDSVILHYRYFLSFTAPAYTFRDPELMKDTTGGTDEYYYMIPKSYDDGPVFTDVRLRKSGSISRGITVGNNQSLTFSSGLRMQIDGDLGDDMRIVAAITDENIPIQPDGTTQQIQDFDKVYVQLFKGNSNLILGDYEIDHKGTWFSDFYRNVQGAGLRLIQKDWRASFNGAVAKGKFHTNSFQGREGVQGPYRLTGKNNERFIIILAGSERVYLNGELMTRGEANDYTIDYNSGELTFTSQRIISSASRIVVDFEYTDRYYNRSLVFSDFAGNFLDDRLQVRFSYGRDADNHNAPIDLSFSDDDRDTLRNVGDDLTGAFSSGIDSVGYSESDIRYERNDTLVYGVVFERYVFSNDPADAIYDVTFSYVGSGNGYYVKDNRGVNGTVFRWVAPDSLGNLYGDYSPIKVLVLPKLLQVADLKVDFKINDLLTLYTEQAVSAEDKNRFSPLDDDDNTDFANKSGIRLTNLKIADSLWLSSDFSHKYVGNRYQNLDRINKVEYGREWNFNDLGTQYIENVTEGIVKLNIRNEVQLTANGGYRRMGTFLNTVKQLYKAESKHKWLQGTYQFTRIVTDDEMQGYLSRWDRHNGDIFHQFGKIRPGTEIWIEDKYDTDSSGIRLGTFRFTDVKPYIRTIGTEKFQFHTYFNFRREFEFADSLYRHKSDAYTEYLKFSYQPTSTLNIQNTTSLRDFYAKDSVFTDLERSRTFINNFQGNWFSKNRLVVFNGIYEVTSEQLARKEVAFLQVNPGTGEYIWEDYNENGVQEIDEFQIAPNPLIADYIRVLIPTRELFPTVAVNFAGNMKLDMKNLWKGTDVRMLKFLKNVSTITNLRVSQKKEADNDNSLEAYMIDFGDIFGDTTLLDAQYILRQDLYLWKNHPKGNLRFTWNDSKSKLFLATGDETRLFTWFGTDQLLNISRNKSLEHSFKVGQKKTSAEQFNTRNFNIRFYETSPKVNFQLSRNVRLTAGYEYKLKNNFNDSLVLDSKVQIHKLVFDSRFNLKGRNTILAKVELANITEAGESDFSAEFELKEGMQTGLNAIWQIFATWFLKENLELSVTYDGRVSQEKPVIHSGRVQIRAYF